jgi:tRNA dimethylallyltransferase
MFASKEAVRKPLVAIVGPTGSGKSELAIGLALRFGGEIVNYDSVQLYRGFNVGSAKVPFEERRGVPHHLLDWVTLGCDTTAGEYARAATDVLGDISTRGRLPILAGGTGFYLRALLDGLSPAPLADQRLRERLEAAENRRPGVLWRFLRLYDRRSADRIHLNDRQKVSRAVEMSMAGKRPAASIQEEARRGLRGYRVLKLGLMPGRDLLKDKLNQRAEWMFSNGLVEETRKLLDGGVPPDSRAMTSLGYRQAVALLQSELTLSEAITECQARTRQYAKRQLTWFRADPAVQWLTGFGSEDEVVERACATVEQWLADIG